MATTKTRDYIRDKVNANNGMKRKRLKIPKKLNKLVTTYS